MQQPYKYTLAPYKGPRSRMRCPQCGKPNEFSPYINQENGEPLHETVGRCNRELNCGYHYKPAEFFRDNPNHPDAFRRYDSEATDLRLNSKQEPPRSIDYIPDELVADSLEQYEQNHFYTFIAHLFGEKRARRLANEYYIGTTHRLLWKNSTIFWQVDASGRARQAKVMLYDPVTGRRQKKGDHAIIYKTSGAWRLLEETFPEDWNAYVVAGLGNDYTEIICFEDCSKVYGRMLSAETWGLNLVQCFFGEHLIHEYPDKTICVVESEKTAVICAGLFPEFVWIASGGSNGCKWTEWQVFKVFEGRSVILFPDAGDLPNTRDSDIKTFFDKWSRRAEGINAVLNCNISVSPLLEQRVTAEQRELGYDLADLLLAHRTSSGAFLTKENYPALKNYRNLFLPEQ
ncbi:MAG: DUF6371 domain-containing protein, partial [Chitinophagaceae bacterium]